ncbi:transcriptional regulator, rrf2 family, putative [Heliomicrobium modesticaldum Ice1]|uniref:Transcriptional regulator, rrf2 family, putative n=1 Tax=Heliobacterium modesticaldum (strain ATCC 51547 / Ice1) TaxID=498761 RepID=B0TA71_HELMI|nr:Rrf2 family transcriptional regulator [Heliomicrobium modesticaldum]ABZ83608.1 transcriptional regulator, rrf2 family, putative [Heliomicrobium modesticaldum Ice1]
MEITRKAEYAIAALLDLALLPPGESTLSKDIAKRQAIPSNFLPQIMAALSRHGWVDSTRGAGGGVRLAVEAETITLQAVIEVIEGPIAINRCLVGGGSCPNQAGCPLHHVWARAQSAMLDVLAKTTIADLVTAKRAIGEKKAGDGAG